jgi:hypothetical protein
MVGFFFPHPAWQVGVFGSYQKVVFWFSLKWQKRDLSLLLSLAFVKFLCETFV